ncbi:MAG: c-type cytochrome [Actinobacteria bacterium]|nr:c-type cytochrome [Actinomycetota bacterium]MCL6094693.1 c-type cytochrome [Actinomycetota bacterium]
MKAYHLLIPIALVAIVAVVGPLSSDAHGPTLASSTAVLSSRDSTALSNAGDGSSTSSKKHASNVIHLPKSYIPEGRILFEESCASCHGPTAEGSSRAPNLVGLGEATIDFWLSTGRMPLSAPTVQPVEKPPRFNKKQILEIVAFVHSLGPGGPGIPRVNLHGANLANGQSLFTLNCAACHTVTGSGDMLANGVFAPSLHIATPREIYEAIRTGPGNMPRFGPNTLSRKQVEDIIDYVRGPIQHPNNRGGIGLGGVGPVAEGFVAMLALAGLILVVFWIGERS